MKSSSLHLPVRLFQGFRMAHKLLGDRFSFGTVRTAAHESPTLRAHFKLERKGGSISSSETVLEELVEQADGPSKQMIRGLSPAQRAEVESHLQGLPPEDQLEFVLTMAKDPDAGSTGDVSYIDGLDQETSGD